MARSEPGAPSAAGLTVYHCGRNTPNRDYAWERQSFRFYGIEYVSRGGGYFDSRGRRQPLTGGMLFCYGKKVPHRYGSDPANPLEKQWIIFDGPAAERLLLDSLGTTSGAVAVENPNQVHEIFERIHAEFADGSPAALQAASFYLRALFVKIVRSRHAPGGRSLEALNSFLRCRRHIDESFERMTSPFDCLRGYGVTASYLCRLFRRFADTTPYEYLTRLKMNRAAHLLLSTRMPLKQLAEAIAFADPYHLSRAFKRFYGVSPSHFRGAAGEST